MTMTRYCRGWIALSVLLLLGSTGCYTQLYKPGMEPATRGPECGYYNSDFWEIWYEPGPILWWPPIICGHNDSLSVPPTKRPAGRRERHRDAGTSLDQTPPVIDSGGRVESPPVRKDSDTEKKRADDNADDGTRGKKRGR